MFLTEAERREHELTKAKACACVMTDAELYQALIKLALWSNVVEKDGVTMYAFGFELPGAQAKNETMAIFVKWGKKPAQPFRVSAKDRRKAVEAYARIVAGKGIKP
jgi:hypothetical protein